MKIKGVKQNVLYIKIIKFYKQIKYYGYGKDDIIKCLDVYPLIGAVLKKKLDYIERGGDDTTCRKIKRKSTQYKNDYRIWHDYAGDYRTKNNIMKEQ